MTWIDEHISGFAVVTCFLDWLETNIMKLCETLFHKVSCFSVCGIVRLGALITMNKVSL